MKVNDLMQGRTEGMVFALKIVKAGGIEALEKEIQSRNHTGVSMNILRKEFENGTGG